MTSERSARPCIAYEQLCVLACSRGLHVEIDVEPTIVLRVTDCERNTLCESTGSLRDLTLPARYLIGELTHRGRRAS